MAGERPTENPGAPAGAGLARLSPREREILALLAQGHTAKSIAAEVGCSVASVNERLRQARLKTGTASSRALARLLAAQENRDERIDLAPAAAPASFPRFRNDPAKGAIAMGFLIGTAAAAAAAFLPQPSATPAPAGAAPDPLMARVLPTGRQDPRRLAELFAGEPRDAVWAGGAEAALRALYAPLVRQGAIALQRIACARTICEVVGTIAPGDAAQVAAATRTLRDPRRNLVPAAAAATLVGVAIRQQDFAIFWIRPD